MKFIRNHEHVCANTRWPKFHRPRWIWFIATVFLASCSQSLPPSEVVLKQEEAGKINVKSTSVPSPLRNVYFGDLHVHTRNSYDAYLFSVRATLDDAYVYAKGGTIKHPMGYDLRLGSGPLDFLAVADHAEYLGVLPAIDTPGTKYSEVPYAKDLFSDDRGEVLSAFVRFVDSLESGERLSELADMSAVTSAWQETIRSAERHNDPGRFTSFIAYEYTSLPGIRNLHRNVIFASAKVPAMPYSALESQNPEDLWRWMENQRAEGMEVLAIPHNSNASDGTMFELTKWNGTDPRRSGEPSNTPTLEK